MDANELIVEFMVGILRSQEDFGYAGNWPHAPGVWVIDHTPQPNLMYHTSWDWLMPVVEKINSIGYDVLINATGLHNETHSCDITTTTDVQAATTSKVLIECVYNAVVEFIKWYNQQKK